MIKGQKLSSILHYFEKIGTNLSTVEYFKTYFFILILLKYLNYKISCFFYKSNWYRYFYWQKQMKTLEDVLHSNFPTQKCTSFCFWQLLNKKKKSLNTDPIKLKEYYLGTLFNWKYQVSSCMAFRHMMNMRIYM